MTLEPRVGCQSELPSSFDELYPRLPKAGGETEMGWTQNERRFSKSRESRLKTYGGISSPRVARNMPAEGSRQC